MLATTQDVEARLGRELEADEAARASALLTDAAALVVGYCGQSFPTVDDEPATPPAVTSVVASMVARALAVSPEAANVERESTGPFTVAYAAGSTLGAPWLSKSDKLMLRPFRSGVMSVPVRSERGSSLPWWAVE